MLSDEELEYFYHGLARVLKRYRRTSMLGWLVVLCGCLSIPLGWNVGRSWALVDVLMTIVTILAGLVVVWQNISALDEYLRVPFPSAANGEVTARTEVLGEIKSIMNDVAEGGWQDANEAIGKLNTLQVKFGLPEIRA